MPKTNEELPGATIDDLIWIARSMGCELHIEFRPRCEHKHHFKILTTPGIEHKLCGDCLIPLDSQFFTKSNGKSKKSVRKVGQ